MVQINSKKQVSRRVVALRRAVRVDTQKIRAKTIKHLQEIFHIATDYARGKIVNVTGEYGQKRPITIAEKQS